MAGTGVSVAGAGMLRTRRRDVSVKPNRKLDRKSSRGMIYENEELRLRTIRINAEVEQGQNDIKKLRRENEQLRREIWSLRDEYDKLEEILKRQKSREGSEEYEDRSDEDDGLESHYSSEQDEDFAQEENGQEPDKDLNKAEQLENAENQKISSEKMTNSLHRLHVDFDDLSVVDEEEELKKDKEKGSSEDGQHSKEGKSPPPILKPRHLHENIPFYPGTYEPSAMGGTSYYAGCPFKFPSTLNLMMPADATEMDSSCPRLDTDPLLPITGLPGLNMSQMNDQTLHVPPVGWQSNILVPQKQMATYGPHEIAIPSGMQMYNGFSQEQQRYAQAAGGFSNFPNLVPRRNVGLKQQGGLVNAGSFGEPQSKPERLIMENGWSYHVDTSKLTSAKGPEESLALAGTEKPQQRQFFAPISSKLKKRAEEPSPTISHFGTANSSSSGRTESTVISKNQFMFEKGSADVYVNGAVPCEGNDYRIMGDQKTFLSTDNLLINDDRSTCGNQLVKSMSCQDLTSESQAASIGPEGRQQLLTQSDNTLDNISDSKPFKSHLSVTLKRPWVKEVVGHDTPEIPKLPSVDYRIFKNPFLRTFDPSYGYVDKNNVTRPLSVQVNDDSLGYYPAQPDMSTLHRVHPGERYKHVQPDQSRLLIPSNQLVNGKLVTSPGNKHEIQVTSFEKPSPHTLVGPSAPYKLSTLQRLNRNPYLQSQNLYQNAPYAPRGGLYPQRGMMYYDNLAMKVPVQTQTSIDGDSHHEDEHAQSQEESAPTTPSGQRPRKPIRKDKNVTTKEHNPVSPATQRKLKKQSSSTSAEIPESPGKVPRKKPRRLSITTTTTSEGQEDKHESRSSSSGQDSPKKDQMRRMSLYFNAKKRPSLASVKTARSGSLDMCKEKDAMMNSERERTTSISSRDIPGAKTRKVSTSSSNVPWCACWGNGCI
ncbi:uncharacterized protein LOC128896291 isoform X1 [Hylaeus anthracinus]|uniref:uncharacterized protein LOC128896291 isoform X1 n=1 Tax=Hylaeus anthracinus TaxID=313031 RepID=UPI0023B9A028|nr:uncharacterized protein LOC128896291 isoform X1 [Hylaeus anthracinus]XP_054015533.1 uncharacterized protein LOC128896291 isoform X1 [Hylaeus anthracinus]XP_054015534.1 uncharacterized protein LOC128896291 isoform X1 [Hylaeus anthracinus]